jgi:methyl-accepting chemotaxis protein
MHRRSMGLRAKMTLGFGVVVIIMLSLGGLVAWNIYRVRERSQILEQEHIVEIEMANNLERFVHQAMYAIRGYAFTEDPQSLDTGLNNLEQAKQQLEKAEEFVVTFPHLKSLGEAIAGIKTHVSNYGQLVQENIARNEESARSRKSLKDAAEQYTESCLLFLTHQNESLKVELFSGTPPAQILTRVQKITIIHDVIKIGNDIRLTLTNALAFREPELFENAQANFDRIDEHLETLWDLTESDENMEEIESISAAAHNYQRVMKALIENWTRIQELEQQA